MTKIFMTPWIDLSEKEINSCIKAGANSARIHTGKASTKQINDLINLYYNHDFKFYLDLRGNKAKTLNGFKIKVGDKIVITTDKTSSDLKLAQDQRLLLFNFIPEIFNTDDISYDANISIDDDNIIMDITKIVNANGVVSDIYATITKATNKYIYKGDGISSSNVNIHSNKNTVLTNIDKTILELIPIALKDKVKYIAISFCENTRQLQDAKEAIDNLGYDAQLVPKVETIKGIKNIHNILKWIKRNYSTKAEIMIGRGDLSLDMLKSEKAEHIEELILEAITQSKKYNVKISILALILQSIRWRLKQDPNATDLHPTKEELQNIKHWKEADVYQIGLTNDMYVDKPQKVIKVLKDLLDNTELI